MSKILVGFLGYGRMAQAISEGLNRNGLATYDKQMASDILKPPLERLRDQRGFKIAKDNGTLLEKAPIVILAVKPHQMRGVLTEVKELIKEQLIISIAAGVTLGALSEFVPPTASLVRVIPNLPALIGKGVTLMCSPAGTEKEDLENARRIFKAVGEVYDLPEALFNEGTAVSGSGPAYFFQVMESMIRGAVRMGLTWDMARQLVVKTCEGAAATALARPHESLGELRDQVTSPGGTTAEGLLVMEDGKITSVLHHALKAAADKGKKLG
jgi:pyrroline-5-carboxylate reductase